MRRENPVRRENAACPAGAMTGGQVGALSPAAPVSSPPHGSGFVRPRTGSGEDPGLGGTTRKKHMGPRPSPGMPQDGEMQTARRPTTRAENQLKHPMRRETPAGHLRRRRAALVGNCTAIAARIPGGRVEPARPLRRKRDGQPYLAAHAHDCRSTWALEGIFSTYAGYQRMQAKGWERRWPCLRVPGQG